jgi:benzoate/toluate 1,2-dioxygenase subunit beta
MPVDRIQVERFLYREADLMDEHRYDEWLALWDLEDATYWVPANSDDIDPARNVSIIHDRRGQLRNRIQRLNQTLWLKEQAPRLRRLVSNIDIEAESAEEVTVNSKFILAELHRHNQVIWAGSTIHKLVPRDGTFKIKYKKVLLLNNNEPMPNMLFLI